MPVGFDVTNGRAKGAAGERELIKRLMEWLGPLDLKRNLEQTRAGGHDIVGLDAFAIEVKRYAKAGDADLKRWWEQSVRQASAVDKVPALAYKLNHREWRVRIPFNSIRHDIGDTDHEWAVDLTIQAFCSVVRETL
jgi:Holliday junction resolvase